MEAENKPYWRLLSQIIDRTAKRSDRLYRTLVLLSIALPVLASSSSIATAETNWQPKIISYRPLTLLVSAEQIISALNKELQQLTTDEFVENKVRFRLSEAYAFLEPNGKGSAQVQIQTKIEAQTSIPIVGKIKADARAKLWLAVGVVDWQTQVVATDSDIHFSNDIVNLAFQLVRSRIENRMVQLTKDSLESLNQTIQPGSSESLKLIQARGRLDGELSVDGLKVLLNSRSASLIKEE